MFKRVGLGCKFDRIYSIKEEKEEKEDRDREEWDTKGERGGQCSMRMRWQ